MIDDVADFVKNTLGRSIDGIIVSGDLAYGGTATQYTTAAQWLDRLTQVAGCPITEIQVVPGNHDINREGICKNTKRMLEEIATAGESELDSYLQHPKDRDVFYARFDDYREFAEGYDCPLDREGGAAGHKIRVLSPGRSLRFIGLNSALLCSVRDSKGKLLLGARQRVLPRTPGEELVVIVTTLWTGFSIRTRRSGTFEAEHVCSSQDMSMHQSFKSIGLLRGPNSSAYLRER